MRAPRSLLLILGGTALVVGAVLAFGHYSDASGRPCDRPFTELEGGRCATGGRVRAGGGVVLMLGGVAALVIWTRQSRLSASSPPPEGGSPDPTPGDPSPS